MSWAAPLALMTATLLGLLSLSATPPLSFIGWFWAGLHLVASIAAWSKR